MSDKTYLRLMDGEFGFVENLTVVFALGAVITGIFILKNRNNFPFPTFRFYIWLIILGCIYIAGEEISWGQHYFGWEASDSIAAINRQNETNLHNIHKIFGVVPKIFLERTIYMTGVFSLVRLCQGTAPYHPGHHWQFWYLPTHVVILTSILTFIYRIIDRIENWFHLDFLIDPDEMHECLLSLFLVLYMLSIYRRLNFQSEELLAARA